MRRHTLPVAAYPATTDVGPQQSGGRDAACGGPPLRSPSSVAQKLQDAGGKGLRVGQMGQMRLTWQYVDPSVGKGGGDHVRVGLDVDRAVGADDQQHGPGDL